jgi:hypothetical protein
MPGLEPFEQYDACMYQDASDALLPAVGADSLLPGVGTDGSLPGVGTDALPAVGTDGLPAVATDKWESLKQLGCCKWHCSKLLESDRDSMKDVAWSIKNASSKAKADRVIFDLVKGAVVTIYYYYYYYYHYYYYYYYY